MTSGNLEGRKIREKSGARRETKGFPSLYLGISN